MSQVDELPSIYTARERLDCYQAALEHIQACREEDGEYGDGICHALAVALDLTCNPDIDDFPELLAMKPHAACKFEYWWRCDDAGDAKRMMILRVIIKEMTETLNKAKQ